MLNYYHRERERERATSGVNAKIENLPCNCVG